MEDLAKQYLGLNLQKGYQMSDWSGDLTDEQLEYAAQDAMVLPKLRAALIPLLVRNGLINTAKLEFDCLAAVVDMELNGMRLDIDRWKQLTQQLQSDMEKAASELQSMLREAIVGESPSLVQNARP